MNTLAKVLCTICREEAPLVEAKFVFSLPAGDGERRHGLACGRCARIADESPEFRGPRSTDARCSLCSRLSPIATCTALEAEPSDTGEPMVGLVCLDCVEGFRAPARAYINAVAAEHGEGCGVREAAVTAARELGLGELQPALAACESEYANP